MGYQPTFIVTWEPNWPNGKILPDDQPVPDPSMEEVLQVIILLSDGHQPGEDGFQAVRDKWEEILNGDLPTEWPDHERIMAQISRKWPDTIFKLMVEGEDNTTMDYHLNGMTQTVEAETVFPPMQRNLMRPAADNGSRAAGTDHDCMETAGK